MSGKLKEKITHKESLVTSSLDLTQIFMILNDMYININITKIEIIEPNSSVMTAII